MKTKKNNKSKKIYEELWGKIRYLIRLITKDSDVYDKKYLKIKFDSDDELPLNKSVAIPGMIIVVRDVFHKNNKYYPQIFSDECLYKLSII